MNFRSSPSAQMPVPGCQLGSWFLIERYDAGAFGIIFRAQRVGHPEAGVFAVKVARAVEDPRFYREVALIQSLHHPSAPRFEESGEYISPSGARYPFFVMEWVEGLPLYRWARSRTSREVLQVLHQLASALAAAHAQGGLHRDVKGDNVVVRPEGRAVLLDWGAGSILGARPITDSALPPGTASYRTPEAVRWNWAHRMDGTPYQAGPEDDVYALGVTAYRLCTGTYPPQPQEHSGPPVRLLAPRELATVSTGLDKLLMACLSERRQARPSAANLAMAFEAAAAEPDATLPIAPTPSAAPTQSTNNPGPKEQRKLPAWVGYAAAGGMGALGLLGGGWMERVSGSHHATEPYTEAAQLRLATALATPNGGVGNGALTEAWNFPSTGRLNYAIGLRMPKTPLPDQRKPPCERGETTINGACWVKVADEKPPCGPKMFDYGDGCYMPSADPPHQPSSVQP
jgi:serine/threonine protein kinase